MNAPDFILRWRLVRPEPWPIIRDGPAFRQQERAHGDADVVRVARLEVLEPYAVDARNAELVDDANAHIWPFRPLEGQRSKGAAALSLATTAEVGLYNSFFKLSISS